MYATSSQTCLRIFFSRPLRMKYGKASLPEIVALP